MKCRLFDLIPCYTRMIDEDFFNEHDIEGVTLEEYEKMSDSLYDSIQALKATDNDNIYISDIYRFNRFYDEDLMVALVINDEIISLYRIDTLNIKHCEVKVDANSKIAMSRIRDIRDARIQELKLAYAIQFIVDAYESNNYAAIYDHSYICVANEVKAKDKRYLLAEVEPKNYQQYNEAIEKLRRIKNQYTQRKLVLTEYYKDFE